jgi:hypothetical protein
MRRRLKIRVKTKQRLMFRRAAKIEDSGKDKAVVDVSPSGQEIKIRAKAKQRLLFLAFDVKKQKKR